MEDVLSSKKGGRPAYAYIVGYKTLSRGASEAMPRFLICRHSEKIFSSEGLKCLAIKSELFCGQGEPLKVSEWRDSFIRALHSGN